MYFCMLGREGPATSTCAAGATFATAVVCLASAAVAARARNTGTAVRPFADRGARGAAEGRGGFVAASLVVVHDVELAAEDMRGLGEGYLAAGQAAGEGDGGGDAAVFCKM